MPVAIVMAVIVMMFFVASVLAVIVMFVVVPVFMYDDFLDLCLSGLRGRFLAADGCACRAAYGTADDRAIASAHC